MELPPTAIPARLPPVSLTSPASFPRSGQEFLEWNHRDYEGGLVEWVDGEVLLHEMPKDCHQNIVEFLDRLLGFFVQLGNLGKIRIAPYFMRISEGGNIREPDVMFIAAQHRERITEHALYGPADLIVEVVSDDSVVRDRRIKFAEYQAGGVGEYWFIDPRPGQQRADFYVRDDQGYYQVVAVGDDGFYRSTVLTGFWLRVAWLWQDDPDVLAALAEVVGVESLVAALRQDRGS